MLNLLFLDISLVISIYQTKRLAYVQQYGKSLNDILLFSVPDKPWTQQGMYNSDTVSQLLYYHLISITADEIAISELIRCGD